MKRRQCLMPGKPAFQEQLLEEGRDLSQQGTEGSWRGGGNLGTRVGPGNPETGQTERGVWSLVPGVKS